MMRGIPQSLIRLRPLLLLGAACAIAIVSCVGDGTGPRHQSVRLARGLAFNARFPDAMQISGAAGIVPFVKVRVLLHHSNGTVALDTLINFPAGADQLTLALTVALLSDAPADGEVMQLELAYINAAGETVFHGGPVPVLVVSSSAGQPAPVDVLVSYTGPGANATGVKISPPALSVTAGDNFSFTATAVDANGATIPNTPIIWTSLDPAVATLTSAAAGAGTAKLVRGTARIVAQLITSGNDTGILTVLPKAGAIAAASGAGQSGPGGVVLAQPIAVKVTATDGLPMAGVSVTFSAGNGGTVGSANATTNATTNANGLAQTSWTLGPALGAQSVSATATGLTGSPVVFGATATAGPATKLAVTTQPANGLAGVTLSAVVITAQDASGNVAGSFSGPVTMTLAANPGGATLRGSLTINAIGGVAVFSTLTLDRAGAGYTLTGSAPGLTSITTNPFNVTAPPAVALGVLSGGGQTGPAGSTLPIVVVVQVVNAANANMADAGRAVSFSVSGGGVVTPTSPVTDADGRAYATWTLGPTLGNQFLTASSSGLTPVTIQATATPSVGQRFTWNGTVDASWTNPANWTPSGVPGAQDTAYVRSGPFLPGILAPTSLASLAVGGCFSMRLTSTLTISANIADSSSACLRAPAAKAHSIGQFADNGTVILTGNGTLMGDVQADLLITGGTHTLIGGVSVSKSLVVSGTARLVLNGSSLNVSNSLTTSGSGTIEMTNVNDFLIVNGNALFGGGSETGLLTAGQLWANGDFSQAGSSTAFAAGGTHLTVLASDGTQNVTFANPATSFFRDLRVDMATNMALSTNVTVRGTLANSSCCATFSSATGNLLTVSGLSFAGSPSAFTNARLRYTDGVVGAATFDNVSFSGFATGATFFDFNRTSGGPYNFTNLAFSGTLSTIGRYVTNTGTVPLTLTTPSPTSTAVTTACGCASWFTAGIGGIIWP